MTAARVRGLADPASGKTWHSECAGERVALGAAPGAAGRRSEKTFADPAQARAHAEKEELKRLRQGWRLVDPAAAPGQPALLYALGRGYTGALAVTALDDGATAFNSFDDATGRDEAIGLSEAGDVLWRVPLPGLCWQLIQVQAQQRVLMRLDHGVLAFAPASAQLHELVAQNRRPASFLSVGGARAAWYAEPQIEIADLDSGERVVGEAAEPSLHGGHSLQMAGALSPDGAALVCCATPGELLRLRPGAAPTRHGIDAAMIDKMMFSPDGRWLFLRERYGQWRWLCLDAATLQPRADAPAWRSERSDLAIAADGRIALSHGAEVAVYDPDTLQCTLQFRADHVARSAALAWSSARIAVRTDLGCAGLYAAAAR